MAQQDNPLAPQDSVFSTLNPDGSRRWLRPRLSPGAFLTARRIVAYFLLIVFSGLPWVTINGKPAMLLDVVHRHFTFFGTTFLPTDTLLLALLLIILFVTVFLVTALFGRIWCGWACPQTVYLEFIYRPIERLFEGAPGKRKPRRFIGLRKVAKLVVYFVISLHLSQTFIAYFVGAHNVAEWIWGSPLDHPAAFSVVAVTTGLMLFDFAYFREQVCTVACPYARMQSVLLDRDSLIVSYDVNRGEPRGKMTKPSAGGDELVPLTVLGDCIDCTLCVQTCPTGIDIRDGLQLECVGCAQCIDACNTVMAKIGRAPNLIKYSSQRIIEGGKPKILRARVIIYPLILIVLLAVFVFMLGSKPGAEIYIIRGKGMPYTVTPETGEIINQVRLRISNRTQHSATYSARVASPPEARIGALSPFTVEPAGTDSRNILIIAPFTAFKNGQALIQLEVRDQSGDFTFTRTYKILGPLSMPKNMSPSP